MGDGGSRERIATGLAGQGFAVSAYADAASFYRDIAACGCELVVIDAALGDENGLSMASHLRSNPNIGIVVLVASTSVEARLKGFECGADACLVDPIDVRELIAQLRVVHRRICGQSGTEHRSDDWSLVNGGWALCDPAGNELPLTTAERTFVRRLAQTPGETVSRAELIACLGGDPLDADPHRIDVLVNRMRHKASALSMVLPVHSVRGKGYAMATGVGASPPGVGASAYRIGHRPVQRSRRVPPVLVHCTEEQG
jgi:DNA-binding response OmpR family regulator